MREVLFPANSALISSSAMAVAYGDIGMSVLSNFSFYCELGRKERRYGVNAKSELNTQVQQKLDSGTL